jgi:hypothetical protein
MSQNAKIVIGILAGSVLLCLCGAAFAFFGITIFGSRVAESMIIDDPQAAEEIAHEIVDYDLPAGYEEQMVMNIMFGKFAVLSPEFDSSTVVEEPTIMLLQLTPEGIGAGLDQDEMAAAMQEGMQSSFSGALSDYELLENRVVEIRGQEVGLEVFEATNEYGVRMRGMQSTIFSGKSGLMMLYILGPIEGWDQAKMDAFIDSIR